MLPEIRRTGPEQSTKDPSLTKDLTEIDDARDTLLNTEKALPILMNDLTESEDAILQALKADKSPPTYEGPEIEQELTKREYVAEIDDPSLAKDANEYDDPRVLKSAMDILAPSFM